MPDNEKEELLQELRQLNAVVMDLWNRSKYADMRTTNNQTELHRVVDALDRMAPVLEELRKKLDVIMVRVVRDDSHEQ